MDAQFRMQISINPHETMILLAHLPMNRIIAAIKKLDGQNDSVKHLVSSKMDLRGLQHYANVLCHMILGDDFDLAIDLPPGTTQFFILEARAVHDDRGDLDLEVTAVMKAWLLGRLLKDGFAVEVIRTATLQVEINASQVSTEQEKGVSFEWRCQSAISTEEAIYEDELSDRDTWHSQAHFDQIKMS
jgi:hypothetical protein